MGPADSWYRLLTYSTSGFGPNALPVPELKDARVPEKNNFRLSEDVFWGFGDQTQSSSFSITYACVPGRVAFSAWGVLIENYQTSIQVRDQRASLKENAKGLLLVGDLYFSAQFKLLEEMGRLPDLSVEMVIKTPASGSPQEVRYMDTPGYWFDLKAGKTLFSSPQTHSAWRLNSHIGFLCYQTNLINQNDAVMYGLKVGYAHKKFGLDFGLNGYSGWMNIGDKPQVLRGKVNYDTSIGSFFAQYQYALRDYPYHRLESGFSIDF